MAPWLESKSSLLIFMILQRLLVYRLTENGEGCDMCVQHVCEREREREQRARAVWRMVAAAPHRWEVDASA